ncbi:MAG TPA: ABC transporter permease subunit [Bryobacteraceae bacterium]|nr:ABC transporter permease subunit [Bryobacteraceae bacterium]
MTRLRAIFLTPAALVMLATLAVPLAIVAAYSFLSRGAYGGVEAPWTQENYVRLFDPLYGGIFLRSAWVSLLATAACLVLGFPLALFIARSGPRKNLYLALVILPFWTSFLIRLYAWMFLLRDTGLVNTVLVSLGAIHAPLPLLYNQGAVILGLIYGYLPFAVVPLYATLERQDPALLDAAADLGSSPWRALLRVTIPLSAPGLWAASILVFVPCVGTLSGLRSARRQQDRADRQSGAESVHRFARLAVRSGRVDRPDGGGDRDARPDASYQGGTPVTARRVRFTFGRSALPLYAACAYLFLHLPLAILAIFSVNASRFTVWEGFSLRWYRAMFADRALLESAANSLLIAVAATALATSIGTLAAYALWKKASAWLAGSLYLSLVTPEIVTGVSLLAFFQWIFRYLHLRLGMHTVILAHVSFSIAYVVLVVMARLRNFDVALEEAALDLGETEFGAFYRVTLPYLAPAIAAAAMLAFTVSIDDYVITSLVAGVDSRTLPMVIYAMARRGVNPVLNAVSTIVVAALGALIVISDRLRKA